MPTARLGLGNGTLAAPPPPPHRDPQLPLPAPSPSVGKDGLGKPWDKYAVPLPGPNGFRGARQGLPSPPAGPAPSPACCRQHCGPEARGTEASAPASAAGRAQPQVRTQPRLPRPKGCEQRAASGWAGPGSQAQTALVPASSLSSVRAPARERAGRLRPAPPRAPRAAQRRAVPHCAA